MSEYGGEQALAGDEALAGADQLVHETAALRSGAAVSEHRGHVDIGMLPDHRAGLGHCAFAGIELDLDELQFLALDLEIHIVGDAVAALMRPGAGRDHRAVSITVLSKYITG